MIYVNEQNKEFHLTNGIVSYIFRVMEKTHVLEQLYYGKAILHQDDFSHLIEREIRPSNNQFEGDHTSSLEHVKQEMPVYGTTDFRYPAVEVQYPDGDTISSFEYSDYRIIEGKEQLPGMPTTFADGKQAQTIILSLKDQYSDLEIHLYYTIFEYYPVITRRTEIINNGKDKMRVNRLMSMCLDLPDADYQFIHLNGAWARETQVQRDHLIRGVQSISSTRGASSHIHNPFMALCEPAATEFTGKVMGFSLIYSGNFLGQIEVDAYHVSRIILGINPYQFNWLLKSGEIFSSPEAVLVYSQDGLNGMSQVFHEFYLNHLVHPYWAHKERPVLINNWEATYFDFNEDKVLGIASKAKELGIELFVLDDGWFGKRDSDNSSLGNWTVDKKKLPNGIPSLAKKVHQLGMRFGLWFEPEMISKDTPLFKEHPEWLIGHPDKNISHGRNQFVLDFSRKEVVEAIFEQMDEILRTANIDYVKWDMNRYISEAYSAQLDAARQGEFFHRYILGVYALYERLIEKYPELLIESCAGGGGRFDPALLYYAPQTWTSDDTDAVERLKIQYGASMVYPLSAIGSHVSEVPNHQVARNTPLSMRGDVAYFGTFGYELDITKLSIKEQNKISKQIATFKKHRSLIHGGTFYRLKSPFEHNETAWMVVSKDQKEALVGYYQVLAKPNPSYERLILKGLQKEVLYSINGKGLRYGDDLMNVGLLFGGNYIDHAEEYWSREMPGDFSSRLYYLCAK